MHYFYPRPLRPAAKWPIIRREGRRIRVSFRGGQSTQFRRRERRSWKRGCQRGNIWSCKIGWIMAKTVSKWRKAIFFSTNECDNNKRTEGNERGERSTAGRRPRSENRISSIVGAGCVILVAVTSIVDSHPGRLSDLRAIKTPSAFSRVIPWKRLTMSTTGECAFHV